MAVASKRDDAFADELEPCCRDVVFLPVREEQRYRGVVITKTRVAGIKAVELRCKTPWM